MSTLAELNAMVDRILQEPETEQISSTEINAVIQTEAVQLFSRHRPLKKVSDITANGTYSYAINDTNFPDWVDGFSYIKNVEYPAGEYQDPQDAKTPFEEFEIYSDTTTEYLRFTRITPTSGKTIRSTYYIPHSVPNSGEATIKATDIGAFANLASSLCAMAVANYFGRTSESTIGADAVAYRDKSDVWATRGKDLYKKYIDYMFPNHLEAAMAMREFDTVYQELQYSRLTHPEWAR